MQQLDLRPLLRRLTHHAGFSAVVIVTLAVGIGATTTVFTLVQAVLLRDLLFADPDRLVWMYNLRTERDRAPLSIPDLLDYETSATTVEALAPFTNWTANLTGSGDAERLEGVRVAGGFFALLGTSPLLGRTLQAADEARDERVAVLTHNLWVRRFGSDATIVGRSILLNGAGYVVVGVMPRGFVFPFRDAEVAVPLPWRSDARRTDRGANFLRVVARIKAGATLTQARADLNGIARRLQRAFPDDDARKTGVSLYPLQFEIVGDYRRILWTLLAAVGVLMAISCGNVANLWLVSFVGRRSELALRASLGASRRHLVQLLLFEAVVLATCAGAVGFAIAGGAIAAWRAFGPATFPRLAEVSLDARVLVFAIVVTGLCVLIAGALPAWAVSRRLRGAMSSDGRSQTGTRGQSLARRGFVAFQIGASIVLLISMTLVARGFARLQQVEPGFEPDGALSVQLSLPPTRYATPDAIVTFYERLDNRLAALPTVRAVGAVSLLPLSGLLNTTDVAFPGRPAPPPDDVPQAHFRMASPGYFAAAGIRTVAGRGFTALDNRDARPVAVVSQTFATRHWPTINAVGQFVQLAGGPPSAALEVVGVVSDVKQFSLDREPTADLYVPLLQMPANQVAQLAARMYWVVRTRDDPRRLEGDVRRAVRAADPEVATSSIRTLDRVLRASLDPRRLNVRLLEFFGEIGTALSALGVYAIAAFSVGSRRRELAIRSAFGANRWTLATTLAVGELRPVAIGLALGLLASIAVSRWLGDLVFAVSPTDPVTYVGAAAVLLGASLVAIALPARRAGLADPAALLRH